MRPCAAWCWTTPRPGAWRRSFTSPTTRGTWWTGSTDGIVINPGAYTHTSVALLDAVKAVGIPTVEVHISDVSAREAFRQVSYIRAACAATISGHGLRGYLEAMDLLIGDRA